MSLARRHRDHVLAQSAAAVILAAEDGHARPIGAGAADTATLQHCLRLTHDLRRLSEIRSWERRADAKRTMIPEYEPWISGLLVAATETGRGASEEILPTIMIWKIDTGDYAGALILADYVLRYDVPLPARYKRNAPSLIVEELADAAIKHQAAGETFPVEILLDVETLTADADMHDEIRAKLMKAIGAELTRHAEAHDAASPEYRTAAERALAPLRRAQILHDRSGVKGHIKRLEKALAATAPVFPPAPPATEQVAPPAA